MRLGWKLAIALVIPLVLLTAVLGYVFMKRSRELLREELTKEGRAIVRVVRIAGEDYLRDRQVSDLRGLVDRIAGFERVLGARLFDERGKLTYQTSSLEPYPFQQWDNLRRVLSERKEIEYRRSLGGRPAMGFIVPLYNRHGQVIGALQVLQLEAYIDEDARITRDFILTLTLAMVIAIILIVLIVTRLSISRPIARLVTSFRDMGALEVPARIPVRGNDEFAWLSLEFNNMRDRLEATRTRLISEQEHRRNAEERLRNSERLAGLGRLAAGLAHEIGTPLNVISGRARS
ncbi:MAG TPA: HAMP domain-containing protein, partial [Candidatus Krumholzibacteria bacterium]|nr:HAMP domain-containing protein [Candidatus Krumholzibacteria bacterium]